MIRRSVWVKTGVFVVIALLGIGYILVHYVGAGRALLGRGYTAYVDLPDSGGLFTSASVTYRGVEVGRVGAITLRRGGIRVALDLSSDRQIPADSRAVVGNGSPIGEQYVDLRPTGNHGPYLQDGSVIPQSRVVLPTSTQELIVNLDRLVRSVPQGDLHTVVTELGATFDQTGPALRRLLDSTHALVQTAQENLPETVGLLRSGGTVLDTQNSLAPSIEKFSRNLAVFTTALRASDSDLRAVLRNGVPASVQLSTLAKSIDATLPKMLGDLTSVGRAASVRIPALRQVLIIYPYVVSTSYGLFPGNGSTRFGIPTPPSEDHQPCKKGYLDPAKRRLPTKLDYPPVRWGSFCREPTSQDVNPRGSRMAPEPNGKRLGDDPAYMNNAGLPKGPGAAFGTIGMSRLPGEENTQYLLASTGGQQRVLGDRSWMWLLFGPMA